VIFINEWLPNPYDAITNQFIELYNDADHAVSLGGWRLEKENGKYFYLDGHAIPARGYLVLTRVETKLAIKQSEEGISLIDARGVIVDQSSFNGSARNGKSFSRVAYRASPAQRFAWASPTPGSVNAGTIDMAIHAKRYSLNVPINAVSLSVVTWIGLILLSSILLAAFVIYFSRTNETLRELFFERNNDIRR
jgi:hypothetical protein